MKKIFLIILLILSSFVLFSQSDSFLLEEQDNYVVGKNHITGKNIAAKGHAFSLNISDLMCDFSTENMIFTLRETNSHPKSLTIYNPAERKIIADRDINPKGKLYSDFYTFDDYLFEIYKGKNYCVDKTTGERLWSATIDVFHVVDGYDIGIGCKSGATEATTLYGIDLKTGKILWQRSVRPNNGWEKLAYVNDSTVIIQMAGLHQIDVTTGKGWDVNMKTAASSTGANVAVGTAAFAFGLVGGAIAGIIAGTSSNPQSLNNASSNILIDGDDVYFAARDRLYRFDKKGKTVWKHQLDEEKISNSFLFFRNDGLFMLNEGSLATSEARLKFGHPYISSIDKESGEFLFIADITPSYDLIFNDFLIKEEAVGFISDKEIFARPLSIAGEVKERKFDTQEKGNFIRFANDLLFVQTDNGMKNLTAAHSDGYLVWTEKDFLVIFDAALGVKDIIDNEQLYDWVFRIDGVNFFKKGKEFFTFDDKGKIAASFKVSDNAILVGDKIYDKNSNVLLEIDLREIVR